MNGTTTKIIIIGAVAILAIAGIAVAMGGGSSSDKYNVDARYNATLELSDGFEGKYGFDVNPPEGMRFAIVHFTLAEDAAEPVSTNPDLTVWSITVQGVTYKATSLKAVSHPEYQLVEVSDGGKASSVAIAEIPEELEPTINDVTVKMPFETGKVRIVRDPSL